LKELHKRNKWQFPEKGPFVQLTLFLKNAIIGMVAGSRSS